SCTVVRAMPTHSTDNFGYSTGWEGGHQRLTQISSFRRLTEEIGRALHCSCHGKTMVWQQVRSSMASYGSAEGRAGISTAVRCGQLPTASTGSKRLNHGQTGRRGPHAV